MIAPQRWRAIVDGPEPLVVAVAADPAAAPVVTTAGPARVEVIVEGWRFEVALEPLARAELRDRAARIGGTRARSGRLVLAAPIPGRVVSVAVAAGDIVEPGQRLLSIEAMKMENAVLAPRAGTIERVGVADGEAVELGDELVVLA